MAVAILATTWPVFGQTTERISASVSGAQAIGGRYTPRPAISADGSTIVFESPISTLVPGDTNHVADIFIASGGTVTKVTASGGVQTGCASQRAAVSANGQFVAFDSCANNLVPSDTNSVSDVFLLDRNTGVITRVSVTSSELQAVGGASFAPAISPNGQYVAFVSAAINLDGGATGTHVYLRDVAAGNTYLVSRTTGGGVLQSDIRPSVADDGTVAFVTTTNVAAVSDNNNVADVYIRRGANTGSPSTSRVSLTATGGQMTAAATRPSISADGLLVAFETATAAAPGDSNGLTDIYIRDLAANTTVLVSRTPGGTSGNGNSIDAQISPSGGYVSFTSQAADIDGPFDSLYDVFRAAISRAGAPVAVTAVNRVSVSTGTLTGESGASDVSDTGRVVFSSDEPLLVAGDVNGDTDVFAWDGTLTRVSVTAAGLSTTYSGLSLRPAPSYDGTIVAFLSSATNLVDGDTNARTDVFVRHRTTGVTERLPIPVGYESIDADWVSMSHDGRFIAYSRGGVFLYDRFNLTTTPVSTATPGGTVQGGSQSRISASGRYVVYVTTAGLDPADTNFVSDIYRYDRITGTNTLVSRAATIANSASMAPSISGDGNLVAFNSTASNLVVGDANNRSDVFVRNMTTGVVTRISTNLDGMVTSVDARDAFISTDGLYVAYLLSSTVLTSEATAASDVYVARSDGSSIRGPLSGPIENTGTAQGSYDPTLSMFGRFLSYRSYVSDIVAGDTNDAADVFGRQILGAPGAPFFGTPLRLTVGDGGAQPTGGTGLDSENPEMIGNGKGTVFQSGFGNLVAGDTNSMVDAFIRAGIFGNGECDYIEATIPGYTAWLAQFGLDPCTNGGSPYADPDGDGWTNEEEQSGEGGDGNPLLGTFTRYFAEGATKTAGLNFDTRIALANPSNITIQGEISYQMPSGEVVPATPFTLQPYERKTVKLDDQPGIDEDGPAFAYEFSTTVKASAPIGVDRTMTWDKNTYSGHAETGVVSTSRKWYFAEGATIGGFNLFYLLQNPSAAPATVEARYLLGTGQVYTKSYVLPPNSRTNVWANVETINGAMPLASAELSAEFTVTSGDNIIAERAMYRGANPLYKAGHESAGVTEPALEWFLAEGNAGDFFDHFVLIGNTTSNAALVEADFIVGNTGTVYTKQYTVQANSRFNIWVDEEELNGTKPFKTGNTDLSVRIRSVNGVPLIVERAMWWPGSSNTWYETHNSPGSTRTAARWVLAEGENGGPIGWNTYILVANTGATSGSISVRLLLPNGVTSVIPGLQVAARSRTTYFLGDLLTAAGLPADTEAGVLIESEGTALPLVVERAMYRNVNGVTFQVGTNALGTPLP